MRKTKYSRVYGNYETDRQNAYYDEKDDGTLITYGSEEYMRILKEDLVKALEHHCAHNRHHPEHFGDRGVDGMNLFDLVEMFIDWLAASKRQNNGNLMVSIDKSCERFNITGTLAKFVSNNWKKNVDSQLLSCIINHREQRRILCQCYYHSVY